MKSSALLILFFICVSSSIAQVTLIPDSNFELFLISEGIDTDGVINGQVFTADIEDELVLNIDMFGIADLTGIEDFTSLELLDLFQMPITDIDLSQNLNLLELRIDDVSINSLDLSNNINLEYISIGLNYSSSIYSSNLSELNVSNNLLLEHLVLGGVNITSLDLSTNNELYWFTSYFMEDLESIDLKNGNNENIYYLEITNPSSLTCLQVDDPLAVIAGTVPPYDNWTIEGTATITSDCNLGVSDYLRSKITLYPNPIINILFFESSNSLDIEHVTIYSITGALITQSTQPRSVDLSDVPSGLYLVEVFTEKGVFIEKIIKE